MTELYLPLFGQLAWIDAILLVWFFLTALSVVYVAYDAFTKNPEMKIMRIGWILVTFFLGPVALFLYVMSCKEPSPGTHETFIQPLWKQALGSTIHCVAGDATGIVIAAALTGLLGYAMSVDFIVEYVFGFIFALLIFQALFMKDILGGSYLSAVRKSLYPEWVSMNFMMAAMFPTMVILMMGRDMRAMDPSELVFWGAMSTAVGVGLLAAYPINVWLVNKKMKHGMGTERALGHGGHSLAAEMNADAPVSVTAAEKFSVAMVSVLALVAGIVYSASFYNLNIPAREVAGAVMPPGMIMLRDTPAEAMVDMAAVDPREVSYTAPADAKGDQTLSYAVAQDGVKEFSLTASVIKWNILEDVQTMAYAFNQQIPGPRIQINEGDRVRIIVKNDLPDSTTIHWHGLDVPNAVDGPAFVTQAPIEPGETFTYEFTVTQSGTYFYHSHDNADRQQTLGLYGAFIVDPKDTSTTPEYDMEYTIQLQEWLVREGYTFPSMIMEGALPNYFTINGKSFPATETIQMKVGQKIRLRFIGTSSNFIHPMHVHGGPFTVIAKDGTLLPESKRTIEDTINVAPGERYDVVWTALQPGQWLVHCHILHHTTNNGVEENGGGGLTMIINVSP